MRKQKQRPAGTPDTSESLSIRIPGELRRALVETAAKRGVTLTVEVVERLQQSFEPEKAMQRVYGRFGSQQNLELALQAGELAKQITEFTGRPWEQHPWDSDQLAKGMDELARRSGAKGKGSAPELKKRFTQDKNDLGRELAGGVVIFFNPKDYLP
jgi:hypothetical protein